MATAEVRATDAADIRCGGSAATADVGVVSISSIAAGKAYVVVASGDKDDKRTIVCTIAH